MAKMDRTLTYACLGLAAVLIADYLFTSWTWLSWNRRPGFNQDVWLMGALAVREGSGLAMGNDHPLYTGILSLWAGRTPEVFTYSKLLSFTVIAATLAATYRIGTQLFGRAVGVLAAALLSLNWIMLSLSMSLRPEVLLPPLFLSHWYCVWRGFKEKGFWWLGAGAFAGLAYLTKGTGLLLAVAWCVGLAAAALRDRKIVRKAPLYLAGFLPLAGLLWWGNRLLFDDASFNFSIRHAMWLDNWAEVGERSRAELTFMGFIARNGVFGLFSRLARGMWDFFPVSLSCLAPSDSFPVAYMLRWPMLGAAAAAVWTASVEAGSALRRWDGAAWFTAAHWGIFFLLFSWYQQVSSSERFVGPMNPMLILLASWACVRAWKKHVSSRLERRYVLWTASGSLLLSLVVLGIKVGEWGWHNPFQEDRPQACYLHAHAWVDKAAGAVLFGPSGDLSLWYLHNESERLSLPEGGPPEDLTAWLEARGIRRAVIDWDMADRPFLRSHFRSLPEQGLLMTRPLPGWRVVYTDAHHSPPHVILLEKV